MICEYFVPKFLVFYVVHHFWNIAQHHHCGQQRIGNNKGKKNAHRSENTKLLNSHQLRANQCSKTYGGGNGGEHGGYTSFFERICDGLFFCFPLAQLFYVFGHNVDHIRHGHHKQNGRQYIEQYSYGITRKIDNPKRPNNSEHHSQQWHPYPPNRFE